MTALEGVTGEAFHHEHFLTEQFVRAALKDLYGLLHNTAGSTLPLPRQQYSGAAGPALVRARARRSAATACPSDWRGAPTEGEPVSDLVDSPRLRVVDLDNSGGRQSLTELIQSKWDSEASAPSADMAVDMVFEWLAEWDDERHHRADTLREAADRLVRKYGVTNRAAGLLRKWADEAEG